jgi:hypothetical protein
MAPARAFTWKDRIAEAIRKEARKAAVLTFLVAILVVLWIRMALKKEGPQQAVAGTTVARIDPASSSKGGAKPLSLESAASVKGWMAAPLRPISRNLFAVKLERFPQETPGAANNAPTLAGFWGDVEKSVMQQADVRKGLKETLQKQVASQLRLTSTMMGAKPRALINGKLVKEGNVVAYGPANNRTVFRVLKIEARRVIIEHEGIQLEIAMFDLNKATMPDSKHDGDDADATNSLSSSTP